MRGLMLRFYFEDSKYEFIIEEPTNNPSMLTACFYITFKILVFERISQLDGCPIVNGVCATCRFMKR